MISSAAQHRLAEWLAATGQRPEQGGVAAVPYGEQVWVSIECFEDWTQHGTLTLFQQGQTRGTLSSLGTRAMGAWMRLAHLVSIEPGISKRMHGIVLADLLTAFRRNPQVRWARRWLTSRALTASKSQKLAARRGPTVALSNADRAGIGSSVEFGLGWSSETLWVVLDMDEVEAQLVTTAENIFATASQPRLVAASPAALPDGPIDVSMSDEMPRTIQNPVRMATAGFAMEYKMRAFPGERGPERADGKVTWTSGAPDMIKVVRREGLIGIVFDSARRGTATRKGNPAGKVYFAGTVLDMLRALRCTDYPFIHEFGLERWNVHPETGLDVAEDIGGMMYEYLPPDVPVKLYLDIDAKIPDGSPLADAAARQGIVLRLIDFVIDRLQLYYRDRPDRFGRPFVCPRVEDFLILDSCDLRKNADGAFVSGKMSFHCILDGKIMFENNVAQAMFVAFLGQEWNKICALVEQGSPDVPADAQFFVDARTLDEKSVLKPVLDLTVYKLSMSFTGGDEEYSFGTAQLFRVPYGYKVPEVVNGYQRRLLPASFSKHRAKDRDEVFIAGIIQRPRRGNFAEIQYFMGPCIHPDGSIPETCGVHTTGSGRMFYYVTEAKAKKAEKRPRDDARPRTLAPARTGPSNWSTLLSSGLHAAVYDLLKSLSGMEPWSDLLECPWTIKALETNDGAPSWLLLAPPKRKHTVCMVRKRLAENHIVPGGDRHEEAGVVFYLIPTTRGGPWKLTQSCMGTCRTGVVQAAERGIDLPFHHRVAGLTAEAMAEVVKHL